MDDADAAFLRDRDGEPRLGDGVHRGGDERDVQADGARELRLEVDLARQNLRVGGHQQDVVEGECFVDDAHSGAPGGMKRRHCTRDPPRVNRVKCSPYTGRMSRAIRSNCRFAGRRILTVSGLNREARRILEDGLARLDHGRALEPVAPRLRSLYFSLKDARRRCAAPCSASATRGVRFELADGLQVLLRAPRRTLRGARRVPARGRHLEEAGEGELRRRFEALKRRLAAEGLFDAGAQARAAPLPRRIGVVTSPTGAALRDVLHVLRRRFPRFPGADLSVPVQGAAPPGRSRARSRLADRRAEFDVLLLVRGGGSLEDSGPSTRRSSRARSRPCDCR